tara:strand:+ start:815 stop:2107 length:1293 start_codon:yes stop_codon:yes gene_type:complete
VTSFERNGAGYIYTDDWNGHTIIARISRISETGGRVGAEVAVLVDGNPVARSSPTLTSVSGLDQFWRKLNRRLKYEDYGIDWEAWAEGMAGRVLDAYRQGEPDISLSGVPVPDEIEFLINPYILRGQPNVLYGEGSGGKSTLALLMAVLMDSGHVDTRHGMTVKPAKTFYLDYETDEYEVSHRIKWLRAGMGLQDNDYDIAYRHCTRPLKDEADQIKEMIRKRWPDTPLSEVVLMVDSLGLATGGALEEAESVLSYFTALRWIGATSLTLTHVNKEGKIYGSIYTINAARNLWELQKEAVDRGRLEVGMFHRKANIIELCQPTAFELRFNPTDLVVESKDIIDSVVGDKKLSIAQMVYKLIEVSPKRRALLPKMVGERTGRGEDDVYNAVTTAISRMLRSGSVIEDPNDKDMVRLPSEQAEEEQDEWKIE